jgi:rod shape determining protein RodA
MTNNRDIRVILKKVKKMNHALLINALLIIAVSLFSVLSATHQKTYGFFYREIIWTVMGIGVYFLFSFINYRNYAKYSKIIYLFNIVLLLSVFVFGEARLGAKRWIPLGPINLQPSEFSKIFIVLTLSELLVNQYKSNFRGMKHIVLTGLHILPIFLLIAKQPDLGTSLVLIFLYCILIFIHGIDWKSIYIIIGAGIAFVPVSYFFLLKEYQKQRVLTFLNPEADMLGSGWNVIQSMIAVGSGGVFGKGLFQGTQSKLRFLPESHTDFIGSVFLEETGLLGGFILLGLYLVLIIQITRMGSSSNDNYGKLVCYGVAAILFFHTVINLGMIMGVMPVTGLPLLLMSYGGSSFLFTFMMLGIVQSIKVYRD